MKPLPLVIVNQQFFSKKAPIFLIFFMMVHHSSGQETHTAVFPGKQLVLYSGEWNDGWKTPRLLERSLVFVSLIQRRDVLVLFQRGWHWRYDVTPLDWSLLPSIISYLQQGVCQLKDVGHIGNLKEN